jgi:hypothetical protein
VTPIAYVAKQVRYWDQELGRPEVMKKFAQWIDEADEPIRKQVNDRIVAWNEAKLAYVRYLDEKTIEAKEERNLTPDEARDWWRKTADMASAIDKLGLVPRKWDLIVESVKEAAKDLTERGSNWMWWGAGIAAVLFVGHWWLKERPIVIERVRGTLGQ